MKTNLGELVIRFLLGGCAVALSYLLAVGSPWKLLGGAFAAFPAVMVSAIVVTGISEGSNQAGKIARGAVYGMLGGVACVAATLLTLTLLGSWFPSVVIGVVVWFAASITIYAVFRNASDAA